MPSRTPDQPSDSRDLLRLLGMVRPYAGVLILSILASFVHSSSIIGRAALTGPLVDDVAMPQAQLEGGIGSSLGRWLGTTHAAPAPDPEQEARSREQVRANIERNFRVIAWAVVVLLLLLPLARVIRDYSADWLGTRLYADLQEKLGAKLLRLPLAHHQRESTGDVIARLANDSFMSSRA